MPAPATANIPANATNVSSLHADTANARSADPASIADLRRKSVRLLNGRKWYGLRGSCEGQGQCGSAEQFDHVFLHVVNTEVTCATSPPREQAERSSMMIAALPAGIIFEAIGLNFAYLG